MRFKMMKDIRKINEKTEKQIPGQIDIFGKEEPVKDDLAKDSPKRNESEFYTLSKQYRTFRTFKDIDKESGQIIEFIEELQHQKIPYQSYDHKTNKGITIFYGDLNESLSENFSDESVSTPVIPAPYDKYFEIDTDPYLDHDGYKPGDKVDFATILAYVNVKEEYERFFDAPGYMLIDDEKFPIVDIVHDRLLPIELPENLSENFSKESDSTELLDINESVDVLDEGNPVTHDLPDILDSFLQDVAQMTQKITYNDIHAYSEDTIKELKKLRKEWIEVAQYDDEEGMDQVGDKIAHLIKGKNEALLETDEFGNDEIDANCENCANLVKIPVDYEGEVICADCREKHESLTESADTYIVTYYEATATRDRRPETIEDVENDWKVEPISVDNDYDALKHAISIRCDCDVDEVEDYYEIQDIESAIEYLDTADWGDGSYIIIKVEGPNGVIYDTGYDQESWIEEFVEVDENDYSDGFEDDDLEFEVEESAENRLMDSLYKGLHANNSEYDDILDAQTNADGSVEDDEIWENDLISIDYDDTL